MKVIFFLISVLLPFQLFGMQEKVLKKSLINLNQQLHILTTKLSITKKQQEKYAEFLYYNLDANIFQRPVLQQVENANCGYYALKDTLYTIRALEVTENDRNQLPLLLKSQKLYNADYEF